MSYAPPDSAAVRQARALEGVRTSALFVCLLTPEYARDAHATAQAAYAAALGKPFVVVRQRGLALPPELDGARVVAEAEVDFDGDPAALADVVARVVQEAARALGLRRDPTDH